MKIKEQSLIKYICCGVIVDGSPRSEETNQESGRRRLLQSIPHTE